MYEPEREYIASSKSRASDELPESQRYIKQQSPDIILLPSKIEAPEDNDIHRWSLDDLPPHTESLLKRSHSPCDVELERPFKRQAGPINFDYIDLLNDAIDEVALHVSVEDAPNFEPTQLGGTYWSTLEKAKLYSALSILGKRNVRALASRIKTKSVTEVQFYLQFVCQAANLRHESDRRSILSQTDYPAAAELSQPCCHELEKAADSLALSQEGVEEERQYRKWESFWDISPAVAEHLERRGRNAMSWPADLQFARLFHVSQWLELSRRVFMNSSVPANNWSFVDDKPPSIWATALEDFHSLTVSFTRRLVCASLQASESRTVDEQARRRSQVVEAEDVLAAVEELGLSKNSKQSWRTSSRRLRLNVFHEPGEDDQLNEDEPLSYDEVESLLGDRLHIHHEPEHVSPNPGFKDDLIHGENETVYSGNAVPEPAGYDTDQEIRDIIIQAGPTRGRDRQNLKRALAARVIAERRQTVYTDEFDIIQSQQIEAEMWAILGQDPPVALTRRNDVQGKPPRSNWNLEKVYRRGTEGAADLQ